MIEALRDQARRLLESGEVDVVIGYAEGSDPSRTTPVFVRTPGEVDRLLFDPRCINSLPLYLNKRHGYPRKGWKRAGIVAKGCDVLAITQLISENQLRRNEVYIFGVPCEGVVSHPDQWHGTLGGENLAVKCTTCEVRTPTDADFFPGGLPPRKAPEPFRPSAVQVAALQGMEDDQRFQFWGAFFDRCFKCYACREVCPHCSCNICITDRTTPSWIDPAAHQRGVFAWHLTRAMHLVGRCTGCGECARACPVDIPLDLLNQRMKEVVQADFGYRAGYSETDKPPLVTYRVDDREDFIA